MAADNTKLEHALDDLLDLVRDMVPDLNQGEYEKGVYLDRLKEIKERLC